MYLAVVLDVYRCRIVGWAVDHNIKSQSIIDAMNMAVGQRGLENVVPTAIKDRNTPRWHLACAAGKTACGRPWALSVILSDNAMSESFFATLECELLDRSKFQTKAEARMAIFEFIEGWYNPARRHSALGYQSPIAYERSQAERLESASP